MQSTFTQPTIENRLTPFELSRIELVSEFRITFGNTSSTRETDIVGITSEADALRLVCDRYPKIECDPWELSHSYADRDGTCHWLSTSLYAISDASSLDDVAFYQFVGFIEQKFKFRNAQ